MDENKKSHRENTAEKYYDSAAYLMGAVLVFVIIISAIPGIIGGELWSAAVCIVIWIVAIGPVIGYYIYQWLYYRNVKLINIQNAEFCGTDSGCFKDIGLRLYVNTDGARRVVTTRRVFGTGVFANSVDRYTCGDITVGYNADRGEWIVLFKDY